MVTSRTEAAIVPTTKAQGVEQLRSPRRCSVSRRRAVEINTPTDQFEFEAVPLDLRVHEIPRASRQYRFGRLHQTSALS